MVCTLLAGVNVVAFAADDNDLIVSVHSFYNDATKGGDGEHLYTKDADEMSWLSSLPTWNDEDEAWKAPVSSSLAVYRVYNPNSGEHHYAAADEAEWLVSQGWTQEKIAFYSDDNMGVPIYRLWNGGEGVGSHYYTTDEGEAAYLASIGWTAEGVNFYGVKEEEPGEKEMTAVQTGANEITVISTTEFTELEQFTVKKGSIDQALALDPIFIDENTVVLYLASDITDDEYTVICSDEEYAPSSFEGEVAELTTIEIGDNLIKDATIADTYNVSVKTLDQFGDEFEVEEWDGATSSVGEVSDWDSEKGILTVNEVDDVTATTVKSSVITLIQDTLVTTKEVPFSAASHPVAVMASPVMMTPEEELINTTGRIDVDDLTYGAGGYFCGIVAMDQYGNVMDDDSLNAAVANSFLVVAGNGILEPIDLSGGMLEDPVYFVTDEESGNVLMFVTSKTKTAGPGVITFIPVAAPDAQSQATLAVAENEKIAEITVTEGDEKLIQGSPVAVNISAVNNYGETVDMNAEVIGDAEEDELALTYIQGGYDNEGPKTHSQPVTTAKVSLTNGEWTYTAPTTTTPAKFEITAGDEAKTVYAVASATTVKQYTFVVRDKATVAGIYGLNTTKGNNAVKTTVPFKSNTGSAITNITIPANVVLSDQYGKPIESPVGFAFAGKEGITKAGDVIAKDTYVYTIAESGKTKGTTLDNTGNITYKIRDAKDTSAVTDTYIVKLWVVTADAGVPADGIVSKANAKEVDTYQYKLNVAAKDYAMYVSSVFDTATFEADGSVVSRPMMYVGDDYDEVNIGLVGVDSAGNIIQLTPVVDYKCVLRNPKVYDGVTLETDGFTVSVKAGEGNPEASGTAYVDVYSNDGTKLLTTVELSFSGEDSEPVLFMCTKKDFVTGNTELYDLDDGISLTGDATVTDASLEPTGHAFVKIEDANGDEYTIISFDQYGLSGFDLVLWNAGDVPATIDASGMLSIAAGSIYDIVEITRP